MRIGIIDICVPNHYPGILTLALTYATDPANKIFIFVTKKIGESLQLLEAEPSVELVIKEEQEKVSAFFQRVSSYELDRIHLNTLSAYFREACQINWQMPIYLTIHNTEECFDYGLFNRTKLLIHKTVDRLYRKKGPPVSLAVKTYLKEFYYHYYRQRFLRHIGQVNGRYIVYSQSQRNSLARYTGTDRLVVFPFTYYDELPDLSAANPRMRLCVVGAISQDRRDYDTLLSLLEQNPQWKSQLTVDFLGYVAPESVQLTPRMDRLIADGYDLIYYDGFVPDHEMDAALSKADIILVNVHVTINFLQKYGKTKESGALFNMIKSGKPGLFTSEYEVDGKLREICLFYGDKIEFRHQLNTLLQEPELLTRLKIKALAVSAAYRLKNLYPVLVNSRN